MVMKPAHKVSYIILAKVSHGAIGEPQQLLVDGNVIPNFLRVRSFKALHKAT